MDADSLRRSLAASEEGSLDLHKLLYPDPNIAHPPIPEKDALACAKAVNDLVASGQARIGVRYRELNYPKKATCHWVIEATKA